MGTILKRDAYQRLIDEDLEWLLKQPRSLERDHIEAIVRASAHNEYELKPAADAALNLLQYITSEIQIASTGNTRTLFNRRIPAHQSSDRPSQSLHH